MNKVTKDNVQRIADSTFLLDVFILLFAVIVFPMAKDSLFSLVHLCGGICIGVGIWFFFGRRLWKKK